MKEDVYHLTGEDISCLPGKLKTHFLNDQARREEKSLGSLTGLNEIDFCMVTKYHYTQNTEPCGHGHSNSGYFQNRRGIFETDSQGT